MFYIDRPLNFIAFGFLASVKMKQKTSVCFFLKLVFRSVLDSVTK